MDADQEEAFRSFVVSRWPALLRTVYLLVSDHGHAEDLVQTALAKVHRRWPAIERKDQPEVYVRRVLVNLANSHWRRRLRVREDASAELPERPGPDVIAAADQRDELWEALRSLPRRMRAVLVLRYFEDLSEADVAKAVGCSIGSVKSQASRGLARLRQAMPGDVTESSPDPSPAALAYGRGGSAS